MDSSFMARISLGKAKMAAVGEGTLSSCTFCKFLKLALEMLQVLSRDGRGR